MGKGYKKFWHILVTVFVSFNLVISPTFFDRANASATSGFEKSKLAPALQTGRQRTSQQGRTNGVTRIAYALKGGELPPLSTIEENIVAEYCVNMREGYNIIFENMAEASKVPFVNFLNTVFKYSFVDTAKTFKRLTRKGEYELRKISQQLKEVIVENPDNKSLNQMRFLLVKEGILPEQTARYYDEEKQALILAVDEAYYNGLFRLRQFLYSKAGRELKGLLKKKRLTPEDIISALFLERIYHDLAHKNFNVSSSAEEKVEEEARVISLLDFPLYLSLMHNTPLGKGIKLVFDYLGKYKNKKVLKGVKEAITAKNKFNLFNKLANSFYEVKITRSQLYEEFLRFAREHTHPDSLGYAFAQRYSPRADTSGKKTIDGNQIKATARLFASNIASASSASRVITPLVRDEGTPRRALDRIWADFRGKTFTIKELWEALGRKGDIETARREVNFLKKVGLVKEITPSRGNIPATLQFEEKAASLTDTQYKVLASVPLLNEPGFLSISAREPERIENLRTAINGLLDGMLGNLKGEDKYASFDYGDLLIDRDTATKVIVLQPHMIAEAFGSVEALKQLIEVMNSRIKVIIDGTQIEDLKGFLELTGLNQQATLEQDDYQILTESIRNTALELANNIPGDIIVVGTDGYLAKFWSDTNTLKLQVDVTALEREGKANLGILPIAARLLYGWVDKGEVTEGENNTYILTPTTLSATYSAGLAAYKEILGAK